MRILLLSSRFPPDVAGGGELLAGDVADELRERGHETWVLTSRSQKANGSNDPWVLRSLREAVDTNHVLRGPAGGRSGRVVAFYRQAHARSSARRLLRAVAERQPDLLYVWDISGIGLTSVLRALRRVSVPIVFHLQNYWWQYINLPETPFTATPAVGLKRLLIGPVPPLRFTTSIAISNVVKQAYVAAGLPEDRIEVIDNAVSAGFLRPRDIAMRADTCLTLMYAGRLCAEKGVIVALEAVHRLVRRDHRDVHLHIYGWGEARYVDEITTFVRQRRIDNAVTFHGPVTRDELIHAYDRTDMVLVPSQWEEPFGLVAIEAMARDVPVIASDVGGLREVIEHGINGLLVRPADAQELAAVITRLAENPEEARRLAAAGRELVLRRYTLDVCTDRIERHLEKARRLEAQESRWVSRAL